LSGKRSRDSRREDLFWGGWGGSIAVMDPGRGATITYVMNKMGPGTTGTERTIRYAELRYEALA
jgi:CubicO group peptidase (beta-lactamase class C family)